MHNPNITLTLTASQADMLEDALLTFAPELIPARTLPALTRDQLPVAVTALQSYRAEIFPGSRAVAQLLRLIGQQGGAS